MLVGLLTPSARSIGTDGVAVPQRTTSKPLGGWQSCWQHAATSTGCAAAPDAGDVDAAFRLASLLDDAGDLDGAAQILRARADAGTGTLPRGWPTYWPRTVTSTSCAPAPVPAMRMQRSGCPVS